jgi:coenzyme F420 hydrogenase subunit beta
MKKITEIVARQLCCGCGACAFLAPDRIEMVESLRYGRRPVVDEEPTDPALSEAVSACPGLALRHDFDPNTPGLISELRPAWGPVLELWEGFAKDPELRLAGSSGGVASALGVHCIEASGNHGVLHTGARPDVPYLNQTILSTTREQILEACGSRYAPASPCDGLQGIADAPAPCVFIGKPCDIAASKLARELRPALDERLGLTVAIFCAGTPSTGGTLEMLEGMGVEDRSTVTSLRYRGNGWPGLATVDYAKGGEERSAQLTYEQSWGQLQRHRQWRCYVCADHTGEFADISVGDPWYRPREENEAGRSLVLVRTERGREILQEAIRSGHLELERVSPDILPASQPNLIHARGSIWGRIWTCRALGAATPRYEGFPFFRFWLRSLTFREKLSSLLGTAKRVFRKGLLKPITIEPFDPDQ